MHALLLVVAVSLSQAPDEVTLSAEEVEAIPGAVTGPFAAIPLLPGASPLLSPLAVASVRGKQPSTVGLYVDGVELPSAFHLLLGPPVLQDAAVAKLSLQRGLSPIEHGRHLGGALTVEVATPSAAGFGGTTSVDLLRAGTLNHWRSESGETAVSAGASIAWIPFIYSRAAGGSGPSWDPSRAALRADLGDYYARAEQRVGQGSVRLLSIGSVDAVESAGETDLIGAGLTFHRVDLRGRHPLWGGEAQASIGFGWDRLTGELGGPVAQGQALVTQSSFGARAGWSTELGGKGTLRAGADLSRQSADLAQLFRAAAPQLEGEPEQPPLAGGVRGEIANAVIAGAWVEALLSDDPSWRWTLGLRADNYHLVSGRNLFAAEPRAAVWHALSEDVSLNAGIGLVHQAPTFLLPLPGVELAALRFGLQEALRVNAGVGVRMTPRTLARLDAYVDPMFRTLELSPLDRDFLQTVKADSLEPSSGYAYGLELLLRRELSDGWFGWLSWTWQRSERDTTYAVRNDFGEPVGARTASLPVGFVQEHAAAVVGGKRFGRWTLSGSAQFHTGAPEVGGLSSTTQREGLDRLRPGPRWVEADRVDAAWLPPFFRLDARVAYAFALGPVELSASLDLQNLTLGRELIKYNYGEESDSLEDRDAGRLRLTRSAGSLVPAVPMPMLGLTARY